MTKRKVLSTRVDILDRPEALELVESFVLAGDDRPRLVFTAYSEFFVRAVSDDDFRMALEAADLVTPDGVGPLAALYYERLVGVNRNPIMLLMKGLLTGLAIVTGGVGQTVPGYWLFGELMKKARSSGWKVFLLGGFGDTAKKLSKKIEARYSGIRIESDPGGSVDQDGEGGDEVIESINRFAPDLLFVAYGPVKQEKWLVRNKERLRAKVAFGVGGTFDEALGLVKEAPEGFSRYGIKWLWRLLQQPSRIGRIWKATVVFAWLVFVESLGKKST